MLAPADIVLSTISGSSETERLQVVLCRASETGRDGENATRLELRLQSYGEGIGWFNQSTIPLEPHQVAELRASLGSSAQSNELPANFRRRSPATWQPRVVHADSA